MGLKRFITSQVLKRKLKHLPASQRAVLQTLLDKHPDIFERIAKDIEAKKKAGMDESLASVAVMRKYEPQLRKIASHLS